jgi:AAA15 family ATPase/GTPase
MFIEFSVANFRSIRERQTLSMVASPTDKLLPENVIDVSLPGLSKTQLLKSAVLYGPNASGKSNILKALYFVDWFVRNSATSIKPDGPTKVEPFRLDLESRDKPSEFEITFVVDEIRHQFGFALDATKVYEEWLYVYPKGKPQCWYERKLDPATGDYEWEFSQKHFKGDKESLRRQTRPNALFLSTGAQFNHEQLRRIQKWFETELYYLALAESDPNAEWVSTAEMMFSQEDTRESVSRLVGDADLGISGVQVAQRQFLEGEEIPPLHEDASARVKEAYAVLEAGRKILEGETRPEPVWLHRVAGSEQPETFKRGQESAGTLRYFAVLGPWSEALKKGAVLFIDELGANIHPLLVRGLLRMIHSPTENPAGAQVIFTTHDVTLLDRGIFRRDQVWLTEKDQEGATKLYPLTDYQPRKDESLAKGYLAGRYGAIPFLRGELAL